MASYTEEVAKRVVAGARGFWTTTHEEQRLINEMVDAWEAKGQRLYTWSSVRGLRSYDMDMDDEPLIGPDEGLMKTIRSFPRVVDERKSREKNQPHLLLLDAPSELKDTSIRILKERLMRDDYLFTVISPYPDIPIELRHLMMPVPFTLPRGEELARTFLKNLNGMDPTFVHSMAESSIGLTLHEALVAARMALSDSTTPDQVLDQLFDVKSKQLQQGGGIFKVSRSNDTWDMVGGLYQLKNWLTERGDMFSPAMRAKGAPTPRGLLLVGPPGTGKTLIGRTVAKLLNYRFVEWDLGRLYNKWVGNTEENTRRLLELTDLHAPCVVYIDEIAHQVSGFESSGQTDSGVVSRVVSSIMTWLEDRKDGTFVVGSTNQPWKLPPHMTRSGRFDAIFHIGLPPQDAMEEILTIHLRKQFGGVVTNIDVSRVAKVMVENKFAGADVEQAIRETSQLTWPRLFDEAQLLIVASKMIPAAVAMGTEVSRIEQWAKIGAREAS